jgi:hypothetical protein
LEFSGAEASEKPGKSFLGENMDVLGHLLTEEELTAVRA